MGVKYVCDRCEAEVPSKDDFHIAEVYLSRRKEQGSKFELCETCAEELLMEVLKGGCDEPCEQ